jgi:hypothetical protein
MISNEQLTEAIRAAAYYLIARCGENGQFEYRLNLDRRVAVKPKYNLVRHAGAIYALALYSDVTKDPAARPAVSKASEFLRTNIKPVSHSPQRNAVWSRREIEGGGQPTQCKLGAAGLALVALGLARKIDAQSASISDLTALAEFVAFMQKDSGEFYAKYYPQSGRRSDKWISLYYPGEAALGLLTAHQSDSEPRWLLAAERALVYLSNLRRGRFPVEPDHWALVATAEYLRINQLAGGRRYADLVGHAIGICESMLYEQVQSGGLGANRGWFTSDCRTTPTATRIEGLLAALHFLPQSARDLRVRIALGVLRGIECLLRSQVHDGPFAGALPRESSAVNMNGLERGAERVRATEVRIDYVQHALCAMIQFREMKSQLESSALGKSPAAVGVCQVDVGLL